MADAVQRMLDQLDATGDDRRRPPVDGWNPALSGDMALRIDREGQWIHEGRPILRKPLVRLFASILRYEEGLGYVLVTPVEKWRIQVEDAPFLATAFSLREREGKPLLCFATNVGEEVCADAAHPLVLRAVEGVRKPYLVLRPGIHAKLSRPVYYELAELAQARGDDLGVWSGGQFFPLQ